MLETFKQGILNLYASLGWWLPWLVSSKQEEIHQLMKAQVVLDTDGGINNETELQIQHMMEGL